MTHAPAHVLDISRLLARAGQAVPTGIDRVELAYAEHLLAHHAAQTHFVALALPGWMGALPRRPVQAFITALMAAWNLGEHGQNSHAARLARRLKARLLLARPLPPLPASSAYFLLSHHHLMKQATIRRFLARTGARFIPMVHDLIPLDYPEYARPREPARHQARMETVATLADAVIVPSRGVGEALRPFFAQAGRSAVPIWTNPHGVHEQVMARLSRARMPEPAGTPYFVCLGTIEPRKNHLLLLHLWRDMVETRGKAAVPRLLLVGKRGWENENILDLLERCPALQDVVVEKNSLSDEDVATLLRGSCGLLFPSFTEGYGLPLAEAMSLSIPSICADIPVFREIGGSIPLYEDPLNAPGWQKAIDDFTYHGPLWQQQKAKLAGWSPLPWSHSVAETLALCARMDTSR